MHVNMPSRLKKIGIMVENLGKGVSVNERRHNTPYNDLDICFFC